MSALRLRREQVGRGPLILVNDRHPLQETEAEELTAVREQVPDIRMERRAAQLLRACLEQVDRTGDIVPVSGWRSQAEQQQIWDDSMAEHGSEFTRPFVALPGCSEHQTGLAIDLGQRAEEIDFIRPEFPYDGVCGAFRQAAARYGFVERYEAGKEPITRIAHEPWHFRYVGVPHAQLMTERGLCLEEYTELVARQPLTCTLENGRRVRVFHVPCAGEETVFTPPEGCVQVSGNNVDGFVVTCWEGRA